MMSARRETLAPRMDPTRYTHSYVVHDAPEYRPYTTDGTGHNVTHWGSIAWDQQDRERRNEAGGQIAYLTERDGAYTISVVGPLTVRDWSAAKLSKARAHNGEWRDVWTGDTILGVTLAEAVARLRALRDAMQEDADAYRRSM